MGLPEVLVTCSKSNEASVRTILRNGGVFISEGLIPSRGDVIQRYRISLDTRATLDRFSIRRVRAR